MSDSLRSALVSGGPREGGRGNRSEGQQRFESFLFHFVFAAQNFDGAHQRVVFQQRQIRQRHDRFSCVQVRVAFSRQILP